MITGRGNTVSMDIEWMLASKKAGQSEVNRLLTPGCKVEGKGISLNRCVGVGSRITYLNDIKK